MERVNLSLHTSSALFTFLSSDSWGEARPFGPPVPGHDGRTMRGTESGAYDPRFPAFHLLTSSSLLFSSLAVSPLVSSVLFSLRSSLTSSTRVSRLGSSVPRFVRHSGARPSASLTRHEGRVTRVPPAVCHLRATSFVLRLSCHPPGGRP